MIDMKKKTKNKKGALMGIMLFKVVHIFLLIVVLLVLVFFVSQFLLSSVNTQDLEMEMFYKRMMQSDVGIAHQDKDTKRIDARIINGDVFLDGLFEEELESRLDRGAYDKFIAAKVILKDKTADDKKYEVVYNQERFVVWDEMRKADWNTGPGGVKALIKNYDVKISFEDEEESHDGDVEVIIITPNS